MFERLAATGNEVGIKFNFDGKVGNTRDSHRMIQLGKAHSPATQTLVVEALFRSYFEETGDITSHAMLIAAAVKAGIDETEARAWLDEGKGGEAVDREVEEARRGGVTGVPNFTIQGKYEVGGAQESEVFLKLFGKIKASERS